MKKNNVYWPVYKRLELEVEDIMFYIHIDNKQKKVYSSKIADIILRAGAEIESISKDLYQQNGGKKTLRKNIKYDFDAIKLLEKKWTLSKKTVFIMHDNYYGSREEIRPFLKNKKIKNKKNFAWNYAYQNLKHDRSKSIKHGSVEYMFDIMAALLILNIYYSDKIFTTRESGHAEIISLLGLRLFGVSIGIPQWKLDLKSQSIKLSSEGDNDSCIYLLWPDRESIMNFLKDKEMPIIIKEKNEKKFWKKLLEYEERSLFVNKNQIFTKNKI